MPSDTRDHLARELVAGRWNNFRAFVVAAHDRAESILAAEQGEERACLELGSFAAGRIDAGRFAVLNTGRAPLDATTRDRIARASMVLGELIAFASAPFVVDVPTGVSVRFAVASAYARLGRVFGAAQVVDLARSGRYDAATHDRLLDWYGFDEWNNTERTFAPPLIVRLDGADFRGSAFAPFMDGAAHIVVIARDACVPAPLVSLITPGTLVLQSRDQTGTDRFASYEGPAIAALMGTDGASFLHDPAGGSKLWQRLRVWQQPESIARRKIGGLSHRQQLESLAQLACMAERPAFSDTPVEALAPGAGDPSERLASWLLAESAG